MKTENEFYKKGATYIHFTGYEARTANNKHTYEITDDKDLPGWKIGDKFAVNEPEKYFTIKGLTPSASK